MYLDDCLLFEGHFVTLGERNMDKLSKSQLQRCNSAKVTFQVAATIIFF